MVLVTDILDLAELTGAAREIEQPDTYVLNTLLPDDTIEDVEFSIRRSTITRGTAEYRSYDAETPIGSRAATTTVGRTLLPPLGQKLVIGEFERILLQRAQGAQNGALINSIYDDTFSNVQSIRSRLEIARGQVLYTGKFTLTDENGLTLEADYDVAADHLDVAPALAWSDENSDLWGFLEQVNETYQNGNLGGQLPGGYMTSRRVVNALRKNKQVIRAQWGPLATEGNVTPAQLNEVVISQGFPAFRINDAKVGGVRVIPDDRVIVTPSNPRDLGRTVFGITADALELVGSNAVDFSLQDAPGITAVTMKDGDPARIWSKATAAAMPVIDDPTLLMVLDVL